MTFADQPATASAGELRQNWPLLLSAITGGILIGVPLYATGVFMADWEGEFGWQRSEIGLALAFYNGTLILVSPFAGRAIDSLGVRKPALLSLALLCPAFLLLSTIGPGLWTLYAAYTAFAAAGVSTTFVSFTRSINEYFDRARGIALSIACSSTTLCMFGTPLLAYLAREQTDWRAAWLIFAGLVLVIWPIVYFGLKEVSTARKTVTVLRDAASGMHFSKAIRTTTLWLLAASFLLMTFAATGPMLQIVPLLRSLGLTTPQAIAGTSALAAGVAVSRLCAGLLLDRMDATRLFKAIAVLGLAGCALLVSGSTPMIVLGVICIGATVGAEGDILAYITARYFGLAHYARIYGLLYSLMLSGAMISPVTTGYIYDVTGAYSVALIGSAVAFLLSILLMHGVARAAQR